MKTIKQNETNRSGYSLIIRFFFFITVFAGTAFTYNSALAQETYFVNEVYSNPQIQEGDTLKILGYYTNTEMGIIVESYLNLMRRQVWRPHSYLLYDGTAPSPAFWNGGIVIAKGVVEFISNPNPFWPQDSLIGRIHVLEWEELIEGINPSKSQEKDDRKDLT